MKKENYRKPKLDLSRLLQILESEPAFRPSPGLNRVTQPATRKQLQLLKGLGIRPKWVATKQEADEMIENYKTIINSVNHRS